MKTLHAILALGVAWLVLGLPARTDAQAPRKKRLTSLKRLTRRRPA